MWNQHLGYVLTCPSNLGTGLRGGVHVKLPHLSKHPKFEEILKRLRLQKRGTGGCRGWALVGIGVRGGRMGGHRAWGSAALGPARAGAVAALTLPFSPPTGGVDTAAVGSVYDVSNADRLGFSEVEQVQMVVDGVKLMVEMEKKLEKNQTIDDMIPAQK